MIRPVGIEHFYHDGRGPELQRICWHLPRGRSLCSVEYFCHDDVFNNLNLRHVRFVAPQVFMFTPEEVIARGSIKAHNLGEYHPAAAFDLGRSEWLLSFNPHHLSRCRHFQLLFYDELLDIICEGLDFQAGAYHDSIQGAE